MHHRAVLGFIDVLTSEKYFNRFIQFALFRQSEQTLHYLFVNSVFAVIQQDIFKALGEFLEAIFIISEKLAHVNVFHSLGVALEFSVGFGFCEVYSWKHNNLLDSYGTLNSVSSSDSDINRDRIENL